MIFPTFLIGVAFLAINIYVLFSILKNSNGESLILPSKTRYAIQLRLEKWFGWVHDRSDYQGDSWKNFWMWVNQNKNTK